MKKTTFLFAFSASVFILLLASFLTYRTLSDFESDSLMVVHTQAVKDELANLVRLPMAFSRDVRNATLYLDTLNNQQVVHLKSVMDSTINRLDSLLSDNPQQKVRFDTLKQLVDDHLKIAERLAINMSAGYVLSLPTRRLIVREEKAVTEIHDQAEEMRVEENKVLIERSIQVARSKKWAPIMLLILSGVSIIILTILFISTFKLYRLNENKASRLAKQLTELEAEIEIRSKLQKLLKSIFDSSQHGIIAFDSIRNSEEEIVDFRFRFVNNEAAKMIGRPINELTDKMMLDVVPGNKESGLFDAYKQVVDTGKPLRKTEYYNFDNIDMWFDISAVKNEDGFVVMFSDITDIKLSESALLEKQEELQATNYELEQFAYIASHDLQEPLRKIRAFGDRLQDTFNDKIGERGSDYIARMQSASERMQRLIEDLLKFSRVSRSESEFAKVDLNTVVSEALTILNMEIELKKAEVNVEKLPTVDGDQNLLVQLFQNLISNALKYSKETVNPIIQIDVSADKREDNGEEKKYWKINVKDNGIGFDPKYKDQIFVIFQRLHGRSEYTGTGIGLAICGKIVKHHNGIIEAYGEPDSGATFTIFLPRT
ncbi:ATP-binding protein [Fulvivirga sp.]|uniref:sensor histidine kinase n=1 Tax=Fulvivirga sp. TaxID=1931237 RepID=UPI0032EE0584